MIRNGVEKELAVSAGKDLMVISVGVLLHWPGIMEQALGLRLYARTRPSPGWRVKGFPPNLNVSAAVRLAGIGPDRTMVRIIAGPSVSRNCHDITVEGEFGLLRVHIENIPPENPETGRLTTVGAAYCANRLAGILGRC